MIVDMKTNCKIDIEPEEAFRILCQTLRMDIVLLEDADVYVKKDEYGDNCVYSKFGKYDDRGDLFIALRNVAVNMFPNVYFRNADYMYNK
jgi:hypothetical protein